MVNKCVDVVVFGVVVVMVVIVVVVALIVVTDPIVNIRCQ